VLREIDPDVMLLQEVRDEESASRLLEAIAPNRYQIAVFSRFRDNLGVGWQQLVIAAKFPAKAAYARSWQTVGLVDPPRGFAFAVFEVENRTFAVYAVHLKSNLAQGDAFRTVQLNILKRELAAQQVLEHIGSVPTETGIRPEIVVVGGDFNTSPDDLRFASEKTLPAFDQAGFLNPILRLPAEQRVTIPAEGRYPPATFDYILTRGVVSAKTTIRKSSVSDHWPVTVVFSFP